MKKLTSLLLAFFAVLFVSSPCFAADEPGVVAEKFYAGYVAKINSPKDTKAWVANSKLVTDKFKKAYAKAMASKNVEADPILDAQDVPTEPFKAEKPEIKDDKATVVLDTAYGEEKHHVTVKMVKVDGAWLLDSVK